MTQPFAAVAVVGAGAVGSYYGAMLARAGHAVTLIGRAAHAQAITRDGLRLEWADRSEQIRVAASTDLAAARGADLLLFCVKSTDTETVARDLAPNLRPDAVVLSMQNGVDNPQRIAAQLPQTVIPVAVYVATAMPSPGVVRHHGRGDLVIGTMARQISRDAQALLERLVDFFATAQVPVRISPNVMAELWRKLLVNCAYNAISALAQAPYSQLAAQPETRRLQRAIVDEVLAVAAADGVPLALDESLQAVDRIAQAMPQQLSSTAQDLARHKPSEIDHLNGFVVQRGAELGIATPANQALHALVKLVETGYRAH
jgi:2-dehydropantoate 2-reductase